MPSWRARYVDGTELSQLDSEGRETAKYTDINRSQLSHFIIVGDDGRDILVLHLKPSQRLIYRMRVEAELDGKAKERVVLVGWQETRNGANFQSLTAIFSDHVEVIDRFDEKLKWFYPVILREEERKVIQT